MTLREVRQKGHVYVELRREDACQERKRRGCRWHVCGCLQTGHVPWHPADLATVARILVWKVFEVSPTSIGGSLNAIAVSSRGIDSQKMFLHKLKAIKAHKSWMKDPEDLQRCSAGLHFPSDSEEKHKEEVTPVKLLQFYRAVEDA